MINRGSDSRVQRQGSQIQTILFSVNNFKLYFDFKRSFRLYALAASQCVRGRQVVPHLVA